MQKSSNPSRERFAAVIETAARELVKIDHRPDGTFIAMPLIYPSGANVLVRVAEAGVDQYFVSDYGLGYSECDMMGATLLFKRHAPQIAANAGVGFDTQSFFVAKVARDQLVGASAAIANCSLEAVSIAALKLSEKKFADETEVLYRRLVSIFTHDKVAKDVPFMGASQTPWHVANVVRYAAPGGADDHETIFEPVTNHHASIATAVTKFHDIARVDNPPRRVAVVRKKVEFGTYLSVLAQAADVVGRDVSDLTLKRLAA